MQNQFTANMLPLLKATGTNILFCLLLCLSLLSNSSAQELQDPTRPITYQPTNKIGKTKNYLPKLSAIIYDAETKSAILNNHIKLVGQTVSGYKLLKIGPNFVILIRNSKHYRLDLFPVVSKSVTNKYKRNP